MYTGNGETKLIDHVCYVFVGVLRVHEQDRTICEGCHLALDRIERHMADLRCYGEEEPTASVDLTLDPHVAVHEMDQSLRNG